MNTRGVIYIVFCALLLAPSQAVAACTVSTTPVLFGTYLGNSNISSTGSITTFCEPDQAVSNVIVRIDAGKNSGGSFVVRKQQSTSSQTLNYNLYADVAHTKIWGDGSAATVIQQGFNLIIYGLLPKGQQAVPGIYSDTVLVTVIW